jgi:murein DD-endopeptidase MepM/ murein hydrolase activator NlpD
MKLFGRKKNEGGPKGRADGLSRARDEVMEKYRTRVEEPPPELPSQAPAAAPDPLAGLAAADPLAALAADESLSPSSDVDPLAALPPAADAVGSDDLLDIFRDAKEEAQDGTLASEVEHITIGDLLGDLTGITKGLGIPPRPVIAAPEPEPAPEAPPEPPEPAPAAPAAEEPIVAVEQLTEPVSAVEDEPEPVVVATTLDEQALEPEPTVQAAPPDDETMYLSPPPADVDEQTGGAALPGAEHGGRYMLHALFFGLSIAAAAGFGVRTAHNNGAFAAVPTDDPEAILAYLQGPVVPPQAEADANEVQKLARLDATPAPTASPTPAPTASPTPTPAPRDYGFRPGQPPYFVYTVESGDSLWSIAEEHGICPDHILWNNPERDENDHLYIGDEMLLPGYRGIIYDVGEGETLAEIAARYSTDVDMIVAYPGNHLTSATDLRSQTSILLPQAIPPEAFVQSGEARWAYTNPSDYGYIWPFFGPITTYYGEERPGYVHYAIDIGGLYQYGTPVLSIAAGYVAKAERGSSGLGNYVVVSHDDGSRSVYGHMQELYVAEGEYLDQGQPVGSLGCSGHSTGTHLHFELWRGGGPVDPLAFLS